MSGEMFGPSGRDRWAAQACHLAPKVRSPGGPVVGPAPVPSSNASRSCPLVGVDREALDPLQGALNGGAVKAETLCKIRERGLRLLPTSIRDEPDRVRLLGQAAARLERADGLELPCGRCHGPTEVGRLGVNHAIQISPHRARNLARLQLQQRRAAAQDLEERDHGLNALPGDHATAAPVAPAGRHLELAELLAEPARLIGRKDELKVRPPRSQAQRAVGQEPAAQIRNPAVLRGATPLELRPPGRGRRGRARATKRRAAHR